MSNFFNKNDTKSALEAQYEAQRIAFGPVVFQVARSMRDLGVLKILQTHNNEGLSLQEIAQKADLSEYATKVLLESSLSADIVKLFKDKYFITKTGYFLENDEMTKKNMNYIHYVNYKGLYYLQECLVEEKPIGLQKVFGDYENIYPALSSLPKNTKESWFDFDHYYSSSAFPQAIESILKLKPSSVLDIGGNTGKFSIQLAQKSENIKITIVDLPEQIDLAKESVKAHKLQDKIDFFPMDLFDSTKALPQNYDIIWMSQFLDCFKKEDIIAILKKVKKVLKKESVVCIMEPLWDRQRFETSAYCIINTSPYFTTLANGYSKMFNSEDLKAYIQKSGLKIVKQIDNVGLCQSIFMCKAL